MSSEFDTIIDQHADGTFSVRRVKRQTAKRIVAPSATMLLKAFAAGVCLTIAGGIIALRVIESMDA